MKQLLLCLALPFFFACNGNEKSSDAGTPASQAPAAEPDNVGTGEMKDGISDYTNNKKSFMLTCRIDASNSLGGENQAEVEKFCECAWEKTKGKYEGEVVATQSKLEKDPTLKDCYESARKK